MSTHKEQVEQAMMRYFCTLATDGRKEVLKSIDLDYARFLAAIRMAWEAEKNLPDDVLLTKRLKQVRVQVKAPRLGKTGRLFTLRYWPESRRLREQGGSYKEIAEYLKVFRKFKISQAYLRRLMEQLDD